MAGEIFDPPLVAQELGRVPSDQRNDWYDNECEQLVEEKNAACARLLQHRTRANEAQYKRAWNKQNSIPEEIAPASSMSRPQPDMCKDINGNLLTNEREVIQRWRQYYKEHLNGDMADNDSGMVTNLGARAQDIRFPAPDLHEILEEIGRLKNNKSLGIDLGLRRAA